MKRIRNQECINEEEVVKVEEEKEEVTVEAKEDYKAEVDCWEVDWEEVD